MTDQTEETEEFISPLEYRKETDLKKKSRRWLFTINNYTEECIKQVELLDAEYLIYGFEVCPTTKTPHIQGYCQYRKTSRTLSEMKKRLPRAHLEIAKGSPEANIQYCKGYLKGKLKADEENKWIERGDPPRQGKRNDLERAQKDLDKMDLAEFSQKHFSTYVKFHKGLEKYKYVQMKHRIEQPIVEWIYGPTGVGKSKYAYNKGESFYCKDHTIWWDGYEQQEVIVIDDFDTRWPFRDLLKLLDRYPYQGQIKGGYVKINSKYILITCDRSPKDLYKGILTDHEFSQLERRITSVVKL